MSIMCSFAPKIVDPSTPGRSYELPPIWAEWLEVPAIKDSYRFGIHTVNQETAHKFLNCMEDFKIHRDKLSLELAKR